MFNLKKNNMSYHKIYCLLSFSILVISVQLKKKGNKLSTNLFICISDPLNLFQSTDRCEQKKIVPADFTEVQIENSLLLSSSF